jgi:hypothetical protein
MTDEWLRGVLAGGVVAGFVAVVTQLATHFLTLRRERRSKRLEVVNEWYRQGHQGLNTYVQHMEGAFDTLSEGEAMHLHSLLAEPFGVQFADLAIQDFDAASVERVTQRIQAMRKRLGEFERELGFPRRKDIGETKRGHDMS